MITRRAANVAFKLDVSNDEDEWSRSGSSNNPGFIAAIMGAWFEVSVKMWNFTSRLTNPHPRAFMWGVAGVRPRG